MTAAARVTVPMTRFRTSILSSLLLLLASLASCTSPPKPLEIEVPLGFGEAWEHFVDVANRAGFRQDTGETDRGLRVFVSRWRESPAPFGKGSRTRLHGEFEQNQDAPDVWRLDFWVERQIVKDIAIGYDAQDKDWSAAGQDAEREQILLGQLRLRYGHELGILPKEEKHGVQTSTKRL